MYTEKEEQFYQWLKQRYDVNIADASIIAQFISDIKKERQVKEEGHDYDVDQAFAFMNEQS